MCAEFNIIQRDQTPICPVDASGCFTSEVTDFAGQYVKVSDVSNFYMQIKFSRHSTLSHSAVNRRNCGILCIPAAQKKFFRFSNSSCLYKNAHRAKRLALFYKFSHQQANKTDVTLCFLIYTAAVV